MMENLGAIREQVIAMNKKRTNADRIRVMSDDELAEWCFVITYNVACYYQGDEKLKYPTSPLGWLDWLKQEATDVN